MDPIQIFQTGDYVQVIELCQTTNPLLRGRAQLKIAENLRRLSWGHLVSKPTNLEDAKASILAAQAEPEAQFYLALIAYWSDDINASQMLSKCTTNKFEVAHYLGLIEFEARRYKQALEYFKAGDPSSQDNIYCIAATHLKLGDVTKATRQAELLKEGCQSCNLLGTAYLEKGDIQQAEKWFNEALKLNPNCFYAQLNKTKMTNKPEAVIKLLTGLLNEDNTNLRIKRELADLIVEAQLSKIQITWGEFAPKPRGIQMSVDLLKQIVSVNHCPNTEFQLGVVEYYLDQFESAQQHFKECVRQNYQVGDCHYYNGLIKEELLDWNDAVKEFKLAIEQKCTSIEDSHFHVAYCYLQLKKPDLGSKQLEFVKEGCRSHVMLGYSFILRGDRLQAEQWFNEALKINPNCFYSKVYKSFLSGKLEETIKHFDQQLKVEKDNYKLNWGKGKVLNRLNKFQLALAQFDLSIAQQHILSYASKGKALRGLQKPEEAIQVISEGLKINGKCPPLLCVMAGAYIDLKQYDEAIKTCDTCLGFDNDNAYAIRYKAIALKAAGRSADALTAFDLLTKVDPNNVIGHIGKASIFRETNQMETLFEEFLHVHNIVSDKKSLMNPVVAKQTREVMALQTEFEKKGRVIEKAVGDMQNQRTQQADIEYKQLKEKKEEICGMKLEYIMHPLRQVQGKDLTMEILQKLDILSKQMDILQKQNELLKFENMIQNAQIEEMEKEQEDMWNLLKNSDIYSEQKIQQWFTVHKGSEKCNYAIAFYWTLLSHFDAYRVANVGALAVNKSHSEIEYEKKGVEYTKDVMKHAMELTQGVPILGNIFQLIDDVVDYTYTQIKNKRYEDRIRSIYKIFVENGTSNIASNVSLVIAKSAQDIADQLDLNSVNVQQPKQSNMIKQAQKYYEQQIEELRAVVLGNNIIIYESVGGKAAIADVVTVIAYLQEHYVEIISKAKKVPLDKQITDIITLNKQQELLLDTRPVPSTTGITPLNVNYDAEKELKAESIQQRDRQPQGGCCIIQ